MPKMKRNLLDANPIRLIAVLAVLLAVLSVAGCSISDRAFEKPIQSYLSDKYGCDFSVLQVSRGFSGNDGFFICAVAESADLEGREFEVYCYPNKETSGATIALSGKIYAVYDKYADIYFADQMEKDIQKLLACDAFVRCNVRFDTTSALHYEIPGTDFMAGMKSCLDSDQWLSYVTVYVIAAGDADMESLMAKVKTYALSNNAYRQYIYFGKTDSLTFTRKHADLSDNDFSEHMKMGDCIQQMWFTGMKRDEGITKETVIK